jgi:cytosine/adenosine deaminase-related metal-dependent hydrolase
LVDTSLSTIEQMKAVVLFQNQLRCEPAAITAEQALAMATIPAARALGLDATIGSLEVGKRADLAIFSLDTLEAGSWHDAVTAPVHSLAGVPARWVLVDGEPLVRDGVFTRADGAAVQKIIAQARARSPAPLERADVPAHRAGRRADPPALV